VCLAESRGYSREQLVRGYTWGPDFYARLFLGYLVYDLASMLIHFRELGDPTAIIHHVIFALMAAYVLAHSIMAFPFVWLAFCEVSTPSVNLRCGPRVRGAPGSAAGTRGQRGAATCASGKPASRLPWSQGRPAVRACAHARARLGCRWHLAVTDRKDGKLYLYNGVLLTLLFFVSRVVLYGAGLLHLATLRRARPVHCALLLRLHAMTFCLSAFFAYLQFRCTSTHRSLLAWACRDVWAGPKANPNDRWVVAAFVAGYVLNLYWCALQMPRLPNVVPVLREAERTGRT